MWFRWGQCAAVRAQISCGPKSEEWRVPCSGKTHSVQVDAPGRAGLDLSGLMYPKGRMGLTHGWSRNGQGRGIVHIDVA